MSSFPCTFSHFPALSLSPPTVCKQRWSLDSAFLPLISDNFLVVDIAAAHMARPPQSKSEREPGLTFLPLTFCIVCVVYATLPLCVRFKGLKRARQRPQQAGGRQGQGQRQACRQVPAGRLQLAHVAGARMRC